MCDRSGVAVAFAPLSPFMIRLFCLTSGISSSSTCLEARTVSSCSAASYLYDQFLSYEEVSFIFTCFVFTRTRHPLFRRFVHVKVMAAAKPRASLPANVAALNTNANTGSSLSLRVFLECDLSHRKSSHHTRISESAVLTRSAQRSASFAHHHRHSLG